MWDFLCESCKYLKNRYDVLDVIICTSQNANALEMEGILLFSRILWINRREDGLFTFGKANTQRERRLWIQTSFTLLKYATS